MCYAPLTNQSGVTWHTSNVKNKLQRVLWVPVEGEREIPLAERRVATAFFWQPNKEEDAVLQGDWEELTEMIALGKVEQITARLGQALHIRPKAASGQILTDAIGDDGEKIRTRPRGFYLRKSFTEQILHRQFN